MLGLVPVSADYSVMTENAARRAEHDALVDLLRGLGRALPYLPLVERHQAEAITLRVRGRIGELSAPRKPCGASSPGGRTCQRPLGHRGEHQHDTGASVYSWEVGT